MAIAFSIASALQVSGTVTLSATTSALLRADANGVVSTTSLQANFSLAAGVLSLSPTLTEINSITGTALTSLTLSGGSGGVNLVLGQGSTGIATLQGLTIGKGTGAVATNSAFGVGVLAAITTGLSNTAFGYLSQANTIDGTNNASFGGQALQANTSGIYNTAIGDGALKLTTTGSHNTGIGGDALHDNTEGENNTSIGVDSLQRNTTGSNNVAVGNNALVFNTTGTQNVGVGPSALRSNDAGVYNTAVGNGTLYESLSDYNTAVGGEAGRKLTTGTSNIFLGYNAGNGAGQKIDAINSIAIGANVDTTASNQVLIGDSNITATVLQGTVTAGTSISTTNGITSTNGPLTISDVAISRYATHSLKILGAVGDTVVLLGADTSATTNAQNGFRFNMFSDGNIYMDGKTYAVGSMIFRCGQGAESGANRTWLTVNAASGAVAFGATTASTSTTTGALVVGGGAGVAGTLVSGGGQGWGVTSVTTAAGTTTIAAASTGVQIFVGSSTQTVQLPAANVFGSGVAPVYTIINRSTQAITLQRAGSDLIEGGVTYSLPAGGRVVVMSDSSSVWLVI